MISQYPKTDREKLVGIRKFIRENEIRCQIMLEPFLIFSRGEDEYQFCTDQIGSVMKQIMDVKGWYFKRTDLMLFLYDTVSALIIELDGSIHEIKTERTIKRNQRYELNGIPYIVINEELLKEKLAIPNSTKLTQDQINTEFKERFDSLQNETQNHHH